MLRKLALILSMVDLISSGSLSDVTSSTFGVNKRGQVAAFGDFNADKNTDIFVISDDGLRVILYLTSTEEPFQEKQLITKSNNDGTIFSNVVPADFDGDAQMDILVTFAKPDNHGNTSVQIYWGSDSKVESTPLDIHTQFADQPIVLDVNGDMIPDLMGETTNGTRFYWMFSKSERNYTMVPVVNGTGTVPLPRLRVPQSSAFVDLNGDLTPDLCVVSQQNGVQMLEYWLSINGVLTWVKNIPLPANLKMYGQLTFVDLGTSDSQIDILLPACEDEDCKKSAIYYLDTSKWIQLPVTFSFGGNSWGFVPPSKNPGIEYIPVTLRAGDYNLDGFPDLLGVLQNTDKNGNLTQIAFIFENMACSLPQCASSGRTFKISYESSLHTAAEKAILPAFYDYTENGILDILITTYANDQKSHIHLLKHKFTDDACFLKVMVVSGLCYGDCPHDREPYGVNQYGPVSFYSTQDSEGKTKTGIATQLTQSAYFSLHLPFTVFGLGQTPNFVDELKVGIAHPPDTSPRNKSWLSIIPNSQLIVIPYPNNEPNSWVNKLFVTPSMLVLLTGATLLGTCGFIAGIVGILHWREKVEDRKEKLQEAHKFHFDAM